MLLEHSPAFYNSNTIGVLEIFLKHFLCALTAIRAGKKTTHHPGQVDCLASVGKYLFILIGKSCRAKII